MGNSSSFGKGGDRKKGKCSLFYADSGRVKGEEKVESEKRDP